MFALFAQRPQCTVLAVAFLCCGITVRQLSVSTLFYPIVSPPQGGGLFVFALFLGAPLRCGKVVGLEGPSDVFCMCV